MPLDQIKEQILKNGFWEQDDARISEKMEEIIRLNYHTMTEQGLSLLRLAVLKNEVRELMTNLIPFLTYASSFPGSSDLSSLDRRLCSIKQWAKPNISTLSWGGQMICECYSSFAGLANQLEPSGRDHIFIDLNYRKLQTVY